MCMAIRQPKINSTFNNSPNTLLVCFTKNLNSCELLLLSAVTFELGLFAGHSIRGPASKRFM